MMSCKSLILFTLAILMLIRQTNCLTFVHYHVHVVNELSSNKSLYLHCKSKDDDLGPQNLATNQEFKWRFMPNIWGTTLFWCYLSPKDDYSHANIVAFVDDLSYEGFLSYCDSDFNCIWVARDDGIYLKNLPLNVDVWKARWEPGRLNV